MAVIGEAPAGPPSASTGPPGSGRESLVEDLRALGVRSGDNLLVHASLRAIGGVGGHVDGGVEAVAGAIGDVLGPKGTVVVYTATADNSTTSRAYRALVHDMSEAERLRFQQAMPGYDRDTTPSTGMGILSEHIRTSPGALRSDHPQTSFAALGEAAEQFIEGHKATCHLGNDSPLARLYDVNARILMLGVGYERCTALHLAEYLYTDEPPKRVYSCVVLRDNRPTWWSYEDVVLDDSDFAALGGVIDRQRYVHKGHVGCANSRLFPIRDAVNTAIGWLAATRKDRIMSG